MSTIIELTAGKLHVKVFETREDLGKHSAVDMSIALKQLLNAKDEVNIIFAAAPSQNEFLENLVRIKGIEWNRVNAFHMDEYIGIDSAAPQRFGNFLRYRIFDVVSFKTVNYLNGNAANLHEECLRYTEILKEHPVDITCMGIGENGHIAFNDPHVALFDDPNWVKVVELDQKCRIQQVNDGCFSNLDQVPTKALTLTIPVLVSASSVFCMVPGQTKADAVKRTIKGTVDLSCPASILKTHKKATMYLDKYSAKNVIE